MTPSHVARCGNTAGIVDYVFPTSSPRIEYIPVCSATMIPLVVGSKRPA